MPRETLSGQTLVTISGQPVLAKISGETLTASTDLSGQMVTVSGQVIAKISGETISALILSGEMIAISGQVIAKISGETVAISTPTEVKTAAVRTIPAFSGGVVLHSGAIKAAIVKAVGANSGDIYLGGGTNRPYSGGGLALDGGEAASLDISDFDKIYLVASMSGDQVSFAGVN